MASDIMNSNTRHSTRLIELLQRQVALYEQLAVMSRRQRDLIATDDPQDLLALLGQRRQVVSGLAALDGQLAPLQVYWREYRDEMPAAERRTVEALLQQASTTLKNVLAADAEDAQRLVARKENTGREMNQLNTGRQAFNAYRATAATAPARVNITDEAL
jgi:hypothetical protein